MTVNSWADVVIVVTVLAPLAAVVLAVAVALPGDEQRWTTIGCAAAAAGAFALLVGAEPAHIARLAPDDLALAAAGATALLALGLRSQSHAPVVGAAVTISLCGVAAGAPDRPSTVGPVLAIAAVSALLVLRRDVEWAVAAAISAGDLAIAAGLHAGGRNGAAAAVLGVALVGLAAGFVPHRASVIVVPVAVVLGLRIAPELSGTSTAKWVAVVLGAASVLLLFAPAVASRLRTAAPCAALVPWALVAALEPVPGTPVAARALGAAAVLALMLGGPLALLAALPGAAVLASAIADGSGWPRAALALLLAATVAGLLGARTASGRVRLRGVDVIALLLTAWFAVRPSAWTWVRIAGVDAYTDGSLIAVAAALIAIVLMTARAGPVELTPFGPWLVADAQGGDRRARLFVPTLVTTLALGVAAGALVLSSGL